LKQTSKTYFSIVVNTARTVNDDAFQNQQHHHQNFGDTIQKRTVVIDLLQQSLFSIVVGIEIMLPLVSDSWKTIVHHVKNGNVNTPMLIYITLSHIAALIGLFSLAKCQYLTLAWAFILWPIS
jgi:hypothetical protein